MFLFLYSIWLILNGRITVEICLIGIPVCLSVFLFMVKYLNYSLKKEHLLYWSVPFLIQYFAILLWEIGKANLQVIKLVLFHPKKIRPVRVKFEVNLQHPFTQVLLANSITLTPGTITAEIEKNHYLVHCLSEEFAQEIDQSVFVKLLQKWEKKALEERK